MPPKTAPRKKAAGKTNAKPAAQSAAPTKKAARKKGVSTRVQPQPLVVPKVNKRTLADEVLSPKSTVKKRSVNHACANKSRAPGSPGAEPLSVQDPKRRLGNFVGKGEAPRKGYRGTGIVGQQKKPNRQN